MPLALHPVDRIVNVHWGGGGVFIAADNDSNIYYLKLGANTKPDEDPVWESLGTLDFVKFEETGWTGWAQGSAYGTVGAGDNKQPVFVLVGGGGSVNAIGIIMASRDGKNWSRVFSFGTSSDSYVGANIFGVVWDEQAQKFYAGGHQSDNFVDHATEYAWMAETDLLFASPDGFTWTEVAREEMKVESFGSEPFPPWPEYTSGFLAAHCSDRVVDSNGNGVPGGNYGYDKNEKLTIAPNELVRIDYLFGITRVPEGSTVIVTFSGEGEPPSYPSDPGLPAICVATAGSKWVVAGGVDELSEAAILVASEAGYTWEGLNPGGFSKIITLTGGVIGKDAGL